MLRPQQTLGGTVVGVDSGFCGSSFERHAGEVIFIEHSELIGSHLISFQTATGQNLRKIMSVGTFTAWKFSIRQKEKNGSLTIIFAISKEPLMEGRSE